MALPKYLPIKISSSRSYAASTLKVKVKVPIFPNLVNNFPEFLIIFLDFM